MSEQAGKYEILVAVDGSPNLTPPSAGQLTKPSFAVYQSGWRMSWCRW